MEVLINLALFIVFGSIIFLAVPKIKPTNLALVNFKHILLPYGVILFSLVGWNAVPEVEKILVRKKELKKIIISGLAIAVCFYFIFGLAISGVTGQSTTKEAFRGLIPFLGRNVMLLGGLFGLFSISTSFLVMANYLKNTLFFDYHFPRYPAYLLALFTPLIFFLMGIKEFLLIISFIGAFVGLIEGTVITLIYKKAKLKGERTPEYNLNISESLIYLILGIFILGSLTQIVYFFR